MYPYDVIPRKECFLCLLLGYGIGKKRFTDSGIGPIGQRFNVSGVEHCINISLFLMDLWFESPTTSFLWLNMSWLAPPHHHVKRRCDGTAPQHTWSPKNQERPNANKENYLCYTLGPLL